MQRVITDNLEALLDRLPSRIRDPLAERPDRHDLLEVVMDLGRLPEARFPGFEVSLSDLEVARADIEFVVSRLSLFGGDNRAGIERTLHRISAIRNRSGDIVGLTCRVGRAVFGTIRIIEDLIGTGKSVLLLGRPGVGKTTMLREVARVLADDMGKRVIIVDTSNEIAGDGDIPHPAIGRARRMQVPTPTLQHAIMIEAVENHMPEVIIIDEIGTELEALASRTIAERGVQLIATAHGNTLENLILNPTLSDLVGGIQSVTLGDEEARRRGTQKSILERKAPPTFDIVVEIQNWERVAVHSDVAEVADALLRGEPNEPEVRQLDENGVVQTMAAAAVGGRRVRVREVGNGREARVLPFGVSRARLYQAAKELGQPISVVGEVAAADVVVTLRNYYRRRPPLLRDAEAAGVPVYVLRNNTVPQMAQFLMRVGGGSAMAADPVAEALREAEEGINQVIQNGAAVEMEPQSAYIRRLQHQLAERYQLSSVSRGREPNRRVRIFRGEP